MVFIKKIWTNDVIVSQSNKKPSNDYKSFNYLGEDSYATVYLKKIE